MGPIRDRVFCSVGACGIMWADRERLSDGDYSRLAFLPYNTLALEFQVDCPEYLRSRIQATAANVQARRGQHYKVSTTGQTVLLGGGR